VRLTDHTITGRLQLDSLRATSAYDLCVRVIECAEVIAADVFKTADQIGQRITFGDVQRYGRVGVFYMPLGDRRVYRRDSPLIGVSSDSRRGEEDRWVYFAL
jgi:hypothetical protein